MNKSFAKLMFWLLAGSVCTGLAYAEIAKMRFPPFSSGPWIFYSLAGWRTSFAVIDNPETYSVGS
jgi:hypothetical protein